MLAEPPEASPESTESTSESDTESLGVALELEARALTSDSIRNLVTRAFDVLKPRAAVLTSGFGMEGCALIDMLATSQLPLSVVFLDTGFHFPETLELRQELERRYPAVRFESLQPALSVQQQKEAEGPELWLRQPDRCCDLRKVRPLRKRLQSADLWLSALTRSQSASRRNHPLLASSSRFGIPKLSPLVAWSRVDIWRYVQRHDVPTNPLHQRDYPTFGCMHCTLPVPGLAVDEYSREGRWQDQAKTECGLHGQSLRPILSTPLAP